MHNMDEIALVTGTPRNNKGYAMFGKNRLITDKEMRLKRRLKQAIIVGAVVGGTVFGGKSVYNYVRNNRTAPMTEELQQAAARNRMERLVNATADSTYKNFGFYPATIEDFKKKHPELAKEIPSKLTDLRQEHALKIIEHTIYNDRFIKNINNESMAELALFTAYNFSTMKHREMFRDGMIEVLNARSEDVESRPRNWRDAVDFINECSFDEQELVYSAVVQKLPKYYDLLSEDEKKSRPGLKEKIADFEKKELANDKTITFVEAQKLMASYAKELPKLLKQAEEAVEEIKEVISSDKGFQIGFERLMQFEGGYSDHAADPGGKTMRGVTEGTYITFKRNYPELAASFPEELKNIQENHAKTIAYKMFYERCDLDKIRNPQISAMLFDIAYQHSAQSRWRCAASGVVKVLESRGVNYTTRGDILQMMTWEGNTPKNKVNMQEYNNKKSTYAVMRAKNSKFKILPTVKSWDDVIAFVNGCSVKEQDIFYKSVANERMDFFKGAKADFRNGLLRRGRAFAGGTVTKTNSKGVKYDAYVEPKYPFGSENVETPSNKTANELKLMVAQR